MALTYEAAVARVEAKLDLEYEAIAEVEETSYGWIFNIGPASPDLGPMAVFNMGPGEIVVDAEAEDVFPMPDVHPHPLKGETWESVGRDTRAALEAGFRTNYYEITIRRVRSIGETARLVEELELIYVIPEVEGSITWTIPQRYSLAALIRTLASPPVTFTMQRLSPYDAYIGFTALAAADCCEFEWDIVEPPAKPLRHAGPPPPLS